MNKKLSVFGLFSFCLVLVCDPAFGQISGKTVEPGVFRGTLFNGSPILVAIDENQKVGYASLKARVACSNEVKVFIGSGSATTESSVSITSTIDARCPDKSIIAFDIRMVYDFASDTMELSYPEFPSWTPATLGRLDFDPSVFTDAIQEMKNGSTWLVMSLFTQTVLDIQLDSLWRAHSDQALRISRLESEIARLGGFP